MKDELPLESFRLDVSEAISRLEGEGAISIGEERGRIVLYMHSSKPGEPVFVAAFETLADSVCLRAPRRPLRDASAAASRAGRVPPPLAVGSSPDLQEEVLVAATPLVSPVHLRLWVECAVAAMCGEFGLRLVRPGATRRSWSCQVRSSEPSVAFQGDPERGACRSVGTTVHPDPAPDSGTPCDTVADAGSHTRDMARNTASTAPVAPLHFRPLSESDREANDRLLWRRRDLLSGADVPARIRGDAVGFDIDVGREIAEELSAPTGGALRVRAEIVDTFLSCSAVLSVPVPVSEVCEEALAHHCFRASAEHAGVRFVPGRSGIAIQTFAVLREPEADSRFVAVCARAESVYAVGYAVESLRRAIAAEASCLAAIATQPDLAAGYLAALAGKNAVSDASVTRHGGKVIPFVPEVAVPGASVPSATDDGPPGPRLALFSRNPDVRLVRSPATDSSMEE